MSYENYILEDFLTDKEFKSWVLHPDTNNQLFWEKWIESHPEQKESILKARELILSFQFMELELISDEEKEDLLQGILGKTKNTGRSKFNKHLIRYAAAACLLIVFSVLIYPFFKGEPPEMNISMVVKENPAGQKSTIRLPDGTRVWLNSASKIVYPDTFINSRSVELQGEAYFEVVKDTEKSFQVTTNGVTTTALGTSFNIKAFPEQHDVEVRLLTGKVSVEIFNNKLNQQEKIFIEPGEQVNYDKHSQTLKKSLSKHETILWKEGILSFQKAGFEQMQKDLERWYGVKIVGQNLNRDLSYTGDFHNESLERVLERMAFTEKFTFRMKQDTIKIQFD